MSDITGLKPDTPNLWPCIGGAPNAQRYDPKKGWRVVLVPVLARWDDVVVRTPNGTAAPQSGVLSVRQWRHPRPSTRHVFVRAYTLAARVVAYRRLDKRIEYRWWVNGLDAGTVEGRASSLENAKESADEAMNELMFGAQPQPQQSAQKPFCLISCCGPKLDRAAAVRDIYTSPLFKKSVRWAEAHGMPWAVLSALHGLVWPDDVIDPYDLSLKQLSAQERHSWALEVSEAFGATSTGEHVHILAGAAYTKPLRPLLEAAGWQVCEPLAGMQIGQRLSYLKSANLLGLEGE